MGYSDVTDSPGPTGAVGRSSGQSVSSSGLFSSVAMPPESPSIAQPQSEVIQDLVRPMADEGALDHILQALIQQEQATSGPSSPSLDGEGIDAAPEGAEGPSAPASVAPQASAGPASAPQPAPATPTAVQQQVIDGNSTAMLAPNAEAPPA